MGLAVNLPDFRVLDQLQEGSCLVYKAYWEPLDVGVVATAVEVDVGVAPGVEVDVGVPPAREVDGDVVSNEDDGV